MADSIISALPAVGILDPNALVPLVQAGVTSQVKASQIASLLAQISGQPLVSHAAGTPNALTASFNPKVAALADGASFLVRAASANTAAATIAFDAIAAKPIVKGANTPLQAGDIAGAGGWLELTYDSALDKFVLGNPVFPAGTAFPSLQVAGAAAVGSLQSAGDVQMASSNSGPLAGFRNVLINGDMRIMQRASPAGGGYGLDRWYVNNAGTAPSVTVFGPFNNWPGEYGSCALQVAGVAGNTGSNVVQKVEAANCRHMAGQNVTMSYWAYQSTGAPVTVNSQLFSANAVDSFSGATQVASVPVTIPNQVWTKVTATFAVPAAAVNGLMVCAFSGMGALVAGQSYSIGNAQLELGIVATPFERRPYAVELAMCQRYYQVISGADMSAAAYSSSDVMVPVRFTVEMRAAPTMSVASWGSIVGNSFSGANTGGTFSNPTTRASQLDITSFSGLSGALVSGYAYSIRAADFRASAEL